MSIQAPKIDVYTEEDAKDLSGSKGVGEVQNAECKTSKYTFGQPFQSK